MPGHAVPFLDAAQVQGLLNPRKLLAVLSSALQQFSRREGSVVQPVRTTIPIERYGGYMAVMPALSYDGAGALGVKVVSWYPDNKKPLHTHHAAVLLFDPRTGVPQAIMDGNELTSARTAATSALAVDACAPRTVRTLAVLGAGVQARSHIDYITLVRQFSEVRIWSRTLESAQACARETVVPGASVTAYSSAADAVRDADVVVTVTNSRTPVLQGAWLRPGAVIAAVGACRPDQRELDDEVMQNAAVIVDSHEGAQTESGDIILSKATIWAELGAVLAGSAPPQPVAARWTVFKSLGMAVEDIAAAQLVMEELKSQETVA